ncbi:MAG: NUDIX domain-containing protein [Geobacteraceae bacterium]|nr:NUDIX domain-containing protein [Geobacteraceae bacterium]
MVDQKCDALTPSSRGWHRKARNERPPDYPERFPVPDHLVEWEVDYPGYAPPYYVSPIVLANDSTRKTNGWADPEDISLLPALPRESLTGRLTYDGEGRPLNPIGRTGLAGRGLLGKWGPNYAADPIITRFNRETGFFELLAVQRRDNGQWAIPGGMVDRGEEVSRTLVRELREETGVELDMAQGTLTYQGYVDDPRNTDHAWMETTARHLHLAADSADRMSLRAGDDARAVRWLPLTLQTVGALYASHCALITTALGMMIRMNPFGLSDRECDLLQPLLQALEGKTLR